MKAFANFISYALHPIFLFTYLYISYWVLFPYPMPLSISGILLISGLLFFNTALLPVLFLILGGRSLVKQTLQERRSTVLVVMLIYASVSVLYRYGPAVRKRFSFFSLGATIASLLIILSSLGFSYFVSNFGQYNELYGSIGALIVTLLWFNLICFILLVGFELNASIAVNRDLKKSIETTS